MDDESAAFERTLIAACAVLIAQAGTIARVVVALSGGRDSTVLVHALARQRAMLGRPLAALHLDHALQAESTCWAAACAACCAELSIPLVCERLSEGPPAGASVEAWARAARHAFFARHLGPHDLLLSAHHEDDNAETFLLNALRGAGPAGLRGIAPLLKLGHGWLGRPLLRMEAAHIACYAQRTGLVWHEDPMNEASNLERGFLRHRVLPVLREHWPAAGRTLARAASLQRAAAAAIDLGADRILDAAPSPRATTLRCAVLSELTADLQADVLRRWIARAGFPTPDAAHVERILTCALAARADRIPSVAWKGVCLKRYDGNLYLLPGRPGSAPRVDCAWHPAHPLQLPTGVLSAHPTLGGGLRAAVMDLNLAVRTRAGGERCRLPGRARHHSLKHLLQAWRIPPWERATLPLVYVGDTLVAVADLFIGADFAAAPDEPGWRLTWTPHSLRA